MSFLNELQKTTNYTLTENGAVTNKSSLDANLDYFALAGAMRSRVSDTRKMFAKAYATEPLTALRTLFYLRDIRGGQGEREIFRAGLQELEKIDPEVARLVIQENWIGEYGRYDDMFALNKGETLNEIAKFVDTQLTEDEKNMAENKPVSLLAKWLPSENASSKTRRGQAVALADMLGLSPRKYRKRLSALREYIKLVEQKMSTKQWAEIDYSKVPSQASRKYVKAFMRNDEDRYRDFLSKVEKGEVKINTSTLYTYEVFDMVSRGEDRAANAMWKNLPDYTNGTDALVLADVSGSMYGRPMSVSVSLALYFAERNKGTFNNKFMTFSANPQVVDVVGNSLTDKLNFIESRDWGMNTDLEAAFDAILTAAVNSGQGQDGMPKVLYIISDMEFDQACSRPSESIFDNAQRKFKEEDLELPHVVFWNVNARNDQAPATKFDNRVTLISGSSQSTFQHAVGGKSPVELMNEVVNGERYARITLDKPKQEKPLEDIPF